MNFRSVLESVYLLFFLYICNNFNGNNVNNTYLARLFNEISTRLMTLLQIFSSYASFPLRIHFALKLLCTRSLTLKQFMFQLQHNQQEQ